MNPNKVHSQRVTATLVACCLAMVGVVSSGCADSETPPIAEIQTGTENIRGPSLGDDPNRVLTGDAVQGPQGKKIQFQAVDDIWPVGFDFHGDRVTATVLALGNIEISSDGRLAIEPIPTYNASGQKSDLGAWVYETRLTSMGRGEDRSVFVEPDRVDVMGSKASLTYPGQTTVFYEHRSDGIKQVIRVEKKLPGEGDLIVSFETSDESSIRLSKDSRSAQISFDDELAFTWNGLIVHDARGREVPARFETSENLLHFVVDDATAEYPLMIDPLANSPAWTRNGAASNNFFAARVSSAGDLNGDGFSDVLVAESLFSGTLAGQGRVLVFLSTGTGLSNTALLSIVGDNAGENFGTGITLLGDLNGDGCGEFAVGAPGFSAGRGRVLVYSPYRCDTDDDTLFPTPVWSASGSAGSRFGRSVGLAGDVNCDGASDLIVGAPSGNSIAVFYGASFQNGYFSATPDWQYQVATGGLGWSVARAGNLAGVRHSTDEVQCDAVVAGAYLDDTVHVFLGSETGLPPNGPSATIVGETGSRFGYSVARAGNIDGSQVNGLPRDSVIVGAYLFNNSEGKVAIFRYDLGTQEMFESWTYTSGQTGSRLGFEVAGAGDVNGDGFDDVLIGSPFFSMPPIAPDTVQSNDREGAAFLFLGSPAGPQALPNWTGSSNQAGSEYGVSVASAGDVNNDGLADILVGARSFDGAVPNGGRAYLYLGRVSCDIAGEFFSVGDVNPDNACELCDPAQDANGWSVASNGTVCGEDTNLCEASTCQEGQCVVTDALSCDDGNPCTIDSCVPGSGCVSTLAPDGEACPSDGLACTDNVCTSGECSHPVSTGCAIDGACYADGDTSPTSDCLVCNSGSSTTSWTPQPVDTACDNGAFCTINDRCNATGSCVAGAPRPCAVPECFGAVTCSNAQLRCVPSVPLTGDACDEGNVCTIGACQAGACVTTGAVDCSTFDEACKVGVCDEGTCSGENLANGPSAACPEDGLACTASVCLEGACDQELLAGFCIIDGACVAEGTLNPDNNCQSCQAGFNTAAYVDLAQGEVCGAATCDESSNEATAASLCDGAGVCVTPDAVACGDFSCDAGACLGECADDDDCVAAAYCNEALECSTENRAPVADAGPDQAVNDGDTVTLDGSQSFDPDGDMLTYQWVQVSGESVTLDDDTSATPQFEAPRAPVEGSEELVFELVVNDGELDSEPVRTTVAVTNDGNELPVAVITGPNTAAPEQIILLLGTDSFDPDGDALVSYNWGLVGAPNPVPTIRQTGSADTIEVTIPANVIEETTYQFSLVVNDGIANSEPAIHDIVVTPTPVDPEPDPDVDPDVGPDAGPDAGDDVGPDAGPDAGQSDIGLPDSGETNVFRGTLQGSTCLCSSMDVNVPTSNHSWLLVFFAFVGLVGIRRRLRG